jgi:hypothetical protein
MSGIASRLHQFVCGLHGHDELLHFEKGRMSLQCVSCGYESPGWEVKGGAAVPPVAAPKARVLRMPLVDGRHVA